MGPLPDFLRPARGSPPLAWLFLVASAAAFAAAALEASAAWQARRDTQDAAALLERPERPRPPSPRAGASELAMAPLRAVLEAPWRERLEAIEASAPAGIAWLAIDLAHGGELLLVGIAPDAAAALIAADRLRSTGLWASVVVTRIEPSPDGRQRFELRAQAAEAAR